MDEDRSDQTVLVEVSKKDVVPQEEVIEEGPDMEVIAELKPVCISCGEKPQERKGRCGMCFFTWTHNNPDWRREGV